MEMNYNLLAILTYSLLLLCGLFFTVATDPYIRSRERKIMLVIIGLCFVLIGQNLFEYRLSIGPARPFLRTLVSVCGYCIRQVFLVLFLNIIQQKGKHFNWWILALANAAIYCTAFFSDIVFTITEDNRYIGGPLSNVAIIVSAILLISLFIQSVKNTAEDAKGEKWIPVFIVLVIVFSILADFRMKEGQQQITFLTIAIIVSSVFYYIWLHLQFVREHEQDLMAAQQARIIMTQIQPHFLFNTIATFKALCRKDPEKAGELADKFGTYLRQNLDSIDTTELIPFEKELEHTRLYTEIEMVRFENMRVDYDIKDKDFLIPSLTVQPLVENAIRHGVRIREEGIITVRSYLQAGNHVICIEDNGIGFDPDRIDDDHKQHIGIRNVRERIEMMCGGSLVIDSRRNEGTVATIRIPQKEE